MRTFLLALTMTFLLPSGAWGQSDTVIDPETGKAYKKKTVYDFEDDVVEGSLVKPEGDYLQSKTRAKKSSLIKLREHFVPEMLKSVEDL